MVSGSFASGLTSFSLSDRELFEKKTAAENLRTSINGKRSKQTQEIPRSKAELIAMQRKVVITPVPTFHHPRCTKLAG